MSTASVYKPCRQDQSFHAGLSFRLGVCAKEFHVLRAQPAAQVTLRQNRGTGLGKNRVASGVVQVVMRVDHKPMGKLVILRISDNRSRAGATSSNVSTTTTPFVPTIKTALLPPYRRPRQGRVNALAIFLTVKSGVSAQKASEENNAKHKGMAIVLDRMPEMVTQGSYGIVPPGTEEGAFVSLHLIGIVSRSPQQFCHDKSVQQPRPYL